MTTARYLLTLPAHAILILCTGFAVMLGYASEVLCLIGETMQWLIEQGDTGCKS